MNDNKIVYEFIPPTGRKLWMKATLILFVINIFIYYQFSKFHLNPVTTFICTVVSVGVVVILLYTFADDIILLIEILENEDAIMIKSLSSIGHEKKQIIKMEDLSCSIELGNSPRIRYKYVVLFNKNKEVGRIRFTDFELERKIKCENVINELNKLKRH